MNFQEFQERKIFSEASGVIAVIDENVKMELNSSDIFEETYVDETKFNAEKIKKISPSFNKKTSVSIISEELYSNIPKIKYDSNIGYYLNSYSVKQSQDYFGADFSHTGPIFEYERSKAFNYLKNALNIGDAK